MYLRWKNSNAVGCCRNIPRLGSCNGSLYRQTSGAHIVSFEFWAKFTPSQINFLMRTFAFLNSESFCHFRVQSWRTRADFCLCSKSSQKFELGNWIFVAFRPQNCLFAPIRWETNETKTLGLRIVSKDGFLQVPLLSARPLMYATKPRTWKVWKNEEIGIVSDFPPPGTSSPFPAMQMLSCQGV